MATDLMCDWRAREESRITGMSGAVLLPKVTIAFVSSVPVWCKPVIIPSGPHVVVPKWGKLELRCHDNATTSGAPTKLRWLRERFRRLEGGREEDGVAYIKVSTVQVFHMGRYVCINNNTMEHSSIYVYVKGGCMRHGSACVCLITSTNENMVSSPQTPRMLSSTP